MIVCGGKWSSGFWWTSWSLKAYVSEMKGEHIVLKFTSYCAWLLWKGGLDKIKSAINIDLEVWHEHKPNISCGYKISHIVKYDNKNVLHSLIEQSLFLVHQFTGTSSWQQYTHFHEFLIFLCRELPVCTRKGFILTMSLFMIVWYYPCPPLRNYGVDHDNTFPAYQLVVSLHPD